MAESCPAGWVEVVPDDGEGHDAGAAARDADRGVGQVVVPEAHEPLIGERRGDRAG